MSPGDSSLRAGQSYWLLSQVKLPGNSRDRELGQNMSSGDISLRTVSIWLAFVIDEIALDSQKSFITSYSRLSNVTNCELSC